jgi:acyl-CoA thioester hydrolase
MPRAIAPEVTITTRSPAASSALTWAQTESRTSARSEPSSAATTEEPSFTTSVMAGESKSEAAPFSHELRVRYGECDAQGVVFNANFLAYVDVVLTEIWRQTMGSYDLLLETGVDTVVGEANLRFLAPGRFDDVLRIEAGFDGLGTTSTVLKLWFRRDSDLLVEADIRYVFVDLKTWEKTPIPDEVRAGLEPLLL